MIYDISNDKKNEREAVRRKLENIGFLKLQESVFVFPFECLEVVNLFKETYFLGPYVQYIVAERIESERDLIHEFYDRKILTDNNV